MPRVVRCNGCQESHLIGDHYVGCLVRCECGRAQTVPDSAPSVPAQTGLLDKPIVQVGSVGLLLVSVLTLGGVIAWVVDLDASAPQLASSASPTTKNEKDPDQGKRQKDPDQGKKQKDPDQGKKQKDPDQGKKQKDPVRDNPQLRALLEQLNAPELETNDKAIKELAESDDPEMRPAIPAVVAAANRHDDAEFRQRAAQALVKLGKPLTKDYDCLRDALQIPHPNVQQYVMGALKDMGDDVRNAMGVMVEALKHRDPEVRNEAFAIMKNKDLAPAARAAAYRLLLKAKREEDEETSLGVLKNLLGGAKPLTAEETDTLAQALRDVKTRPNLRCFAVENLGEGEQATRAIPALLDVLSEKGDIKLLTLSIKALGRIREKRTNVVTSLLSLATTAGEEEIRLESLQVLEKLDPSAVSINQIVERWPAERSSRVRDELGKLLEVRLAMLKREQMKQLLPLLKHEDAEIVQVGLNVVQSRKEDAAEVAEGVAGLLERKSPLMRLAALNTLQALGPVAAEELPNLSQQLLERWTIEKNPAIQQALTKLLRSQLILLKPERMRRLLPPLLGHPNTTIVLVGLDVVQAHKEQAAAVAAAVIDLLQRDSANVRKAALIALEAIGPDVEKTLPNLYQQLLGHWPKEDDAAVKQALTNLLKTRLSSAKRESLRETLPHLLQHNDAAIVLVGLKVVQAHKEQAEDAAADVAALLKSDILKVRNEALASLKALGKAARKALPKLFDLLDHTPKYQCTPLALTVAGIVEAKDLANVRRLVPILLKGLHPKSLQSGSGASKAAISEVLRRFGQPAVDVAIDELDANLGGEAANTNDSAHYRINLYATLVQLGKNCASKENYESLNKLVIKEAAKKYNKDVPDAAVKARRAMDYE